MIPKIINQLKKTSLSPRPQLFQYTFLLRSQLKVKLHLPLPPIRIFIPYPQRLHKLRSQLKLIKNIQLLDPPLPRVLIPDPQRPQKRQLRSRLKLIKNIQLLDPPLPRVLIPDPPRPQQFLLSIRSPLLTFKKILTCLDTRPETDLPESSARILGVWRPESRLRLLRKPLLTPATPRNAPPYPKWKPPNRKPSLKWKPNRL